MRHSKQRDLIVGAICEMGHPTAEEIYTHLKTEHPNLSLGTVYRNLRQLEEYRLLTSIPKKDGGCCFDHNTNEHGHLICLTCGSVLDLPPVSLAKLDEELLAGGFAPLRHDLLVYGTCAKCTSAVGEISA